jgi:hypothetical protein
MIDFDLCSTASLFLGSEFSLGMLTESLLLFSETATLEVGATGVADSGPSEESLFSIGGLMTLGMLVVLQAVLGFDNLLYISI